MVSLFRNPRLRSGFSGPSHVAFPAPTAQAKLDLRIFDASQRLSMSRNSFVNAWKDGASQAKREHLPDYWEGL